MILKLMFKFHVCGLEVLVQYVEVIVQLSPAYYKLHVYYVGIMPKVFCPNQRIDSIKETRDPCATYFTRGTIVMIKST